jgi:hypothetical protein
MTVASDIGIGMGRLQEGPLLVSRNRAHCNRRTVT